MKYCDKLLGIFCILIIQFANNGESACVWRSGDACDQCKAIYLNDQIKQQLDKYPRVTETTLEFEDTFNELRNNLERAMIKKLLPAEGCEKAGLALEKFREFMFQYKNVKGLLDSLLKKLNKMESDPNISENEKFEIIRMTFLLEDSATIDEAMQAIRITRKFLKQSKAKGEEVSDEDEASLKDKQTDKDEDKDDNTVKEVQVTSDSEKLDNLLNAESPAPQELIAALLENLNKVLQKLSENKLLEGAPLNELVNNLGDRLADTLKEFLASKVTLSEQTVTNESKVSVDVIMDINKQIDQIFMEHPRKYVDNIKLNKMYNAKRRYLFECFLELSATPDQVAKAQNAIKEFLDFDLTYNVVSSSVADAVRKLKVAEANPILAADVKAEVVKCRKEIEMSSSIDDANNNLKNCEKYIEL